MNEPFTLRQLGVQDYLTTWQRMSEFTDKRDSSTQDELWLVQHPPVFTQGRAGKAEHLLNPGTIPVIQSDRGGQVTYHGPGQLIIYPLFDLRRLKISVREMVSLLENLAIKLLAVYDVHAYTKSKAPGVYVKDQNREAREAKIASLGLRIRKGCSFHGMSINVDMDLQPFALINPCGYPNMSVTQMRDLPGLKDMTTPEIEQQMIFLFKGFFTDFLQHDSIPSNR